MVQDWNQHYSRAYRLSRSAVFFFAKKLGLFVLNSTLISAMKSSGIADISVELGCLVNEPGTILYICDCERQNYCELNRMLGEIVTCVWLCSGPVRIVRPALARRLSDGRV